MLVTLRRISLWNLLSKIHDLRQDFHFTKKIILVENCDEYALIKFATLFLLAIEVGASTRVLQYYIWHY